MKNIIFIFCIISFFSCQQNKNLSLEPLKIDYIDNIPFLMTQMKIDSVLEIVTYGRIGSAEVGEIYNRYVLHEDNIVKQKLKSLMCCNFGFKFDSLGLLIERHKFTDYSTYYTVNYKREGNTIIQLEKSSFNDIKRSASFLNDEKVVLKMFSNNLDSIHYESEAFQYNENNQLIKKVRNVVNHPDNESVSKKISTSYSWLGNNLNETSEKQYSANGIDYYETITKFDSLGFPASKTIKKNMDTICVTKIHKY